MSDIWSVFISPLYLAVAVAFALVGLYSVVLTTTRYASSWSAAHWFRGAILALMCGVCWPSVVIVGLVTWLSPATRNWMVRYVETGKLS